MKESEAKKLFCPEIKLTCKASECYAWKTTNQEEIKKELANNVFVCQFMIHANKTPFIENSDKNGQILLGAHIVDGILTRDYVDPNNGDVLRSEKVPHEEIMTLTSEGKRTWIERVNSRKQRNLIDERTIQYDTESRFWFVIYDNSKFIKYGMCELMLSKYKITK